MKMFLFLLVSIQLFSYELTKEQIDNLKLVKEIAKQYPDKNGKTHEDIIAAISLTETSAGLENIGDSGKSNGIMQMQFNTVKQAIKNKSEFKNLTKINEFTIKEVLLRNKTISVKLATAYFIQNLNRFNSVDTAISLYNGGTKNVTYISKVKSNLKLIKQYV